MQNAANYRKSLSDLQKFLNNVVITCFESTNSNSLQYTTLNAPAIKHRGLAVLHKDAVSLCHIDHLKVSRL